MPARTLLRKKHVTHRLVMDVFRCLRSYLHLLRKKNFYTCAVNVGRVRAFRTIRTCKLPLATLSICLVLQKINSCRNNAQLLVLSFCSPLLCRCAIEQKQAEKVGIVWYGLRIQAIQSMTYSSVTEQRSLMHALYCDMRIAFPFIDFLTNALMPPRGNPTPPNEILKKTKLMLSTTARITVSCSKSYVSAGGNGSYASEWSTTSRSAFK